MQATMRQALVGTRKYADADQPFEGMAWEIRFDRRTKQFATRGKGAIQPSTCHPKDRQDWPCCYLGGFYAKPGEHFRSDKTAGHEIPTPEMAEELVDELNRRLFAMEEAIETMSDYELMELMLMLWHQSLGFWCFIPHPIEELREVVPKYHNPQNRRPRNRKANKHQVAEQVINLESKGESAASIPREESPLVGHSYQAKPAPIDMHGQSRGQFDPKLAALIEQWLHPTLRPANNEPQQVKPIPKQTPNKAVKRKPAIFLGQVVDALAYDIAKQVLAKYNVRLQCLTVSGSTYDCTEQSIWMPGEIDAGTRRNIASFVRRRTKQYGEPLLPMANGQPNSYVKESMDPKATIDRIAADRQAKQKPVQQKPKAAKPIPKQSTQQPAKTLPGKVASNGRTRARINRPLKCECECGSSFAPNIQTNGTAEYIVCPVCSRAYSLVSYEYWHLYGDRIVATNRRRIDDPIEIGDWVANLASSDPIRLGCKY